MQDKTRVSVGPTTILAIVLGVLPGLITIITKAIEEGSQVTVSGPARWLAYITIGSGAIVLIARYVQSVIQAKQPEAKIQLVPVPHMAPSVLPSGTPALPAVDLVRHLLSENPEIVEQLKGEGVIG